MKKKSTSTTKKKLKCKHKNAYTFHENAPMYCPDCGKYVDGGKEIKTK